MIGSINGVVAVATTIIVIMDGVTVTSVLDHAAVDLVVATVVVDAAVVLIWLLSVLFLLLPLAIIVITALCYPRVSLVDVILNNKRDCLASGFIVLVVLLLLFCGNNM